ncbi:MAG: ATP-binding protein, partial [Thiotrichaceae bacterium]|nr:ATP-binding protein [Thiotrichaceae bacterium]
MPKHNQNRFFLTRQSANIMEDLSRRLKQAGSISLLYGPEGIGKSRLLYQFVETRLTPENSIFVRFNVDNTFVEVAEGEDEYEYDTFFNRQINRLSKNFTLIIDQFDNAPADIQLNILKFWHKVAGEKDFKLIISIQSNGLHQLTELSQRYHLQIDSVELKPLNKDEQLEYLRSTSCTKLRQVVVIPPELKKSLKLTKGLFSELENFRSWYGEQITGKEVSLNSGSKFTKGLLYSISGLLLVSIVAIIFQQQLFNKNLLPLQALDSIFKNSTLQGGKLKIEPEQLSVTDSEPALFVVEEEQSPLINSSIVSVKQPVEPGVTKKSSSLDNLNRSNEPVAVTGEIDVVAIEPVTVEQKTVEPEIIAVEPEKETIQSEQRQTILHQRLLATKRWLDSADNKLASIQIMTLSIDDNSLQSLN